jgi:general secretion pathway protein E/type IV pilus assembly protein PilB
MIPPFLSPAFCATNGIVQLRFDENAIYFGLININDAVLKNRIKKTYTQYKCIFQEMESAVFNLKLSQLYSEEHESEVASHDSSIRNNRQTIIDQVADDAPIVNLLNSIFLEALSKRASDIHIESGPDETAIRYRIDGILVTVKTITQERSIAVSARLKILSNLNVLENRRPQDGHIDIKTDAYSLDVRISIIPSIWGESIVLRLLNRSDAPLELDALGFSVKHTQYLQNILTIPSGLILITGPTGSGKTTTLAAILKKINIDSRKIISIEDPVEYRIPGITQIQVHEELELTFDNLLRRIFRHDPDIIMIGEIRDIETAELAVRAAMTGHLVFATLHTNNAIEAVYRLQNMGIPPYMAVAVLKMIVAQRLVRIICPECKVNGLSQGGCIHCLQTGYWGRTAIAEFLSVDIALSDMIAKGVLIEQLRSYLKEKKFTTLFDDAKEKINSGITTESEIRRELGIEQ